MTSKKVIAAASEPFGFKSEGFDHEIYAQVAMRAELEEIRLIDSSYQMSPDIILDSELDPSQLTNRLGSENVGVAYEADRGLVAGGFVWQAEMRLGRRKALSLKANYFIVYSNLKECDERYVSLYFRKLGKFSTFPYFRALFGSQTSASGFAMPPLPSLKERMD